MIAYLGAIWKFLGFLHELARTSAEGMIAYLGAIWKCRFFWLSLVKMDLASRYRGSVLGICWSLLHPIAMTAILCVVFKYAFNMPNVRTYAPLLFTGLTFWGFFSSV